MPSHKFKYLSDIENGWYVMSIRRFGKAVQFQLSQATNYRPVFLFKKFNICFHSVPQKKNKKTDFINVDTDQGSKNLWFNMHVIFTLLFCINISLPSHAEHWGH